MWGFFTLAVGMSLITYMKQGTFSLTGNILNTTDLFFTVSVTVSILLFGDSSTRFNRFDVFCLAIVLMIVAFWVLTQNHLWANLMIQGILVIAYFPVISRMLITRQNNESYLIWSGMLLAAVLALFSTRGELAFVYTTRAVVCIVLLMAVMALVDWRRRGV